MGTISEKLVYLNGTKQAIKQAINEDFEVIYDKGKNLLDMSTLVNGFVSNNGSFDTSHTKEEMRSDYIFVKPNTTYTFKIFASSWSGITYDNWFGVGEYNSSKTFIKRNTMTTGTQTYITFTTSANTKYIVASARGLSSATKVQLEENSTITEYEPYVEETTFREYADEISSNNAKYKDLIPKETKNATNTLDISNSSGLDKALVTQYGNTYQETNANVFDGTLAQTTYTGTGAVVENSPTRFNFINGYTYTINIKFTSNNISTIDQNRILGIRTYKDIGYTGRGVIINSDNLSSGTGSITFTVEGNYNRFNFINYADFQSGTITITDFEIITNTPTPDYPQEIVNISGKSTLKDVGKNLFDGILEIGNFNSNTGEKIANHDYIINTNPIPVEELTNYKISSNGTGIRMYVFEYKEDMTYNLSVRKTVNADSYLTTNSGTKYINFRTIDANTNLQEKIQVEKGSTVSIYEAYKEQSFDLDLKSKNLLPYNKATETKNDITLTNNGDGTYNIKGTASARTTFVEIYNLNDLNLINGDTYTVSTSKEYSTSGKSYYLEIYNEGTWKRVFLSSSRKTDILNTADGNKLRFTIIIESGTTVDIENIGFQLEKGSTVTDYEEFYDINLCKIGTYKDRIYPLNGKWYLEKKIGKISFSDSDLNLCSVNGMTSTFAEYLSPIIDDVKPSMGEMSQVLFSNITNVLRGTTSIKKIRFRIPHEILGTTSSSTNEEAKTAFLNKMTGKTLIFYYPLETPTTEEITESNYPTLYNQLNNIKLFEGVNHITMTNESGLDVEFDITYYKDWKLD